MAAMPATRQSGDNGPGPTNFFKPAVFHAVSQNPIPAHNSRVFCQSNYCEENIDFLEKLDEHVRRVNELSRSLSEIRTLHIADGAPRQVNSSHAVSEKATSAIASATTTISPSSEHVFDEAKAEIHHLISEDVYPRFVKQQVTLSTVAALAEDTTKFSGLGDCFCLTDPSKPDNPIMFASDGFVDVTGYSRPDIVQRNCRFLQGTKTDRSSVKRLRSSIDNASDSVESLSNYRKDGTPFWNLLYVAPLRDEEGKVKSFLGGQVDLSMTADTDADAMKVLSCRSTSEMDGSVEESTQEPKTKGIDHFFSSLRYGKGNAARDHVQNSGMEKSLVKTFDNMAFESQVESFSTAYSKYIILAYNSGTGTMSISHYSAGAVEMLGSHASKIGAEHLFRRNIFDVLSDLPSPWSSSRWKSYKAAVKESIAKGKAISSDFKLFAPTESGVVGKTEERYVGHWTPCKDVHGATAYAILVIAPSLSTKKST